MKRLSVFLLIALVAVFSVNAARVQVNNVPAIISDLVVNLTSIFTPSAAQVIDAVGDAILANATIVELNPDANHTLTSTPHIADGTEGQIVIITTDPAEGNTVTIQDQGTLASSNVLLLNSIASRAIGAGSSITLRFDGTDWKEIFYNGSLDISTDTNLAVTAPITLTDDAVGITIAKDFVAGGGLTGGEDDVFPKADADVAVAVGAGDGVIVNADEIEVYGLVASDGDPNDAFFVDADGKAIAGYGLDVTGEFSGDPLNKQQTGLMVSLLLAQATTPPGMWAWLTPATTEEDQTPFNGNPATYNNFVADDRIAKGMGWALSFFDGGDEYLNVGDDPGFSWDDSGDNPWSFCAWIQVVDTAGTQVVIAKYDVQNTDREWRIQLEANEKIILNFFDDANNVQITNTVDVALSVGWRFVAHSYDSTGGATALSDTNSVWYIDGIAVAESQTNNGAYVNMVAGATDVTIGANNTGAGQGNFFQGDMGVVWLEDIELTAAQVWLYWKTTKWLYNE